MLRTTLPLIAALIAGVGCGTPTGGAAGTSRVAGLESVDGLVKAEIDKPGVLFIREDHGIGSYDAFLIPRASIRYKRQSRKLPTEIEDEFMAALEQSLVYSAQDSGIPVVDSPGTCVMEIAVALVNVDIERSSSSRTIGEMTLVMEFRDTVSGQPLLRYATENRIANEGSGVARSEQIRSSFDAMLAEMEIGGALRAAGLGDDEIRPGCKGTLAERGRASVPAVPTR